ncbi:MAG: septum formation initiator family protein [Micrococcaceae bacterium]
MAEEIKRGKRVKKKAIRGSVDPSNIEFSISSGQKKKISLTSEAKKKISTSRTSDVAARKTEDKKRVRTSIWGRTDPNKPRPAKSFNGHMIMGTLTGLLCLAFLLGPVTTFASQSHNIEDLENQLHTAQSKYDEAKQLNDKWNDPEYVKQQARVRLFYTMPGEQSYMATGDDAESSEAQSDDSGNTVLPDTSLAGQNSQQKSHWYDTFMQSYNTADQGK